MKNINLEIRQLRAVLAIARYGSFTRAADDIHISQPGLSLMINQVEETLGLRLFDRTTRQVELTEAGSRLVAAAGRILNDFDEMFTDLSDMASCNQGRISIAALPSLASDFVPRTISRFTNQFPGVKITVQDLLTSPLLNSVANGEVDLGIGLRLGSESDLVFSKIFDDRLVVMMRADHHLGQFEVVEWPDLAGTDFIAMSWDTSVRRLTERTFAALGQTLRPSYEVSFMHTAIAMVNEGLGVTVLPSLAISYLRTHDLIVRLLINPVVTRDIGIIKKKNKSLSPAAQTFADLLSTDEKIQAAFDNY